MNCINFNNFCINFKIDGIKKSPFFKEAMTHSSVSKQVNYERMEFLGDTILNFCISKMLFETMKEAKEDILSKKKSFLCSRKVCHLIAKKIKLDEEVILSKRQKIDVNFVLADIFESLICLIYIEFGMDKVYNIVKILFSEYINSTSCIDPKMHLQEITQKRYKQLPKYSLVTKEGTEHTPIFKVSVECGKFYTEGTGSNKKQAEKQAAKKMLSLLNKNNNDGGYFNPFK